MRSNVNDTIRTASAALELGEQAVAATRLLMTISDRQGLAQPARLAIHAQLDQLLAALRQLQTNLTLLHKTHGVDQHAAGSQRSS